MNIKKSSKSWLIKFFLWRNKYFKEKQFIAVLSIAVGLISGLGSLLLKNATFFIQNLLEGQLVEEYMHEFYFVFPVVGLTITYLIMRYVIHHRISHGIPATLYAIAKRKGILKKYQMLGSLILAPVTVGFGGSVGLEGPAVSTGAAIGSNLGQLFRLNQRQRTLLISCASAGALSAILNAPIAAIVFTIEVLSLDLTLSSMLPLLLASISGVITSHFLFGPGILLPFQLVEGFSVNKVPFYIVLGLMSGIVSIYFTVVYEKVHGIFENIGSPAKRIAIGGVLIGIIVYFFPPLYGEGYHSVNYIIEGHPEKIFPDKFFDVVQIGAWTIMLYMLGLMVFKIIASSITFGAGGVGGIFAPTLFMGSVMGFCVSRGINLLGFFDTKIPESNFALIGMAGLLSGVLHAPLTAIFLIAELTGGYNLFVPLMLTATVAFAISKTYSKHSVYSMELGRKGDLITHDKDHAVLTFLEINHVLETDLTTVYPEMNLGEMVKQAVVKSKRNIFPVVDKDDKTFLGIILLDDIREIMFEREIYETTLVKDLMHSAPEQIDVVHDKMTDIMDKFEESNAWNLPVVEDGKYLGFISKSKLFTAYRNKLIEVTQ